jgi:esterase/lipase
MTISDLEKINSPIICIHGQKDQVVPISNSEILISHFPSPDSKFIQIEESNHSFDDEKGNGILCKKTIEFFSENF